MPKMLEIWAKNLSREQKNNQAGGTRRIMRELKKEENRKRIHENTEYNHTPEKSPKKRRKKYTPNPA